MTHGCGSELLTTVQGDSLDHTSAVIGIFSSTAVKGCKLIQLRPFIHHLRYAAVMVVVRQPPDV